MQSFLISSKDREAALKKALSICSQNKIEGIDIENVSFEKLAGIEDIRTVQKRLYLKPFKSDTKGIILQAPGGLTIDSQNCLLKVLEEPPNNTIIILVVENSAQVLPTILSRCKVIEIESKREKFSEKEKEQVIDILSSLPGSGIGKRLKLAQDFGKNREEAMAWLEKMIIILRKNIIDEISKRNNLKSDKIKILKTMQDTYTIIKTTNINQRFALENLFLNL
ncbi:MAG: hypothetical protein A3H50_02145 [Candidatus Levybacteria bacterium RIFCSPLOWO2_02_FULL_37_10]|nr:MAG: hypothetical protein A2860_02765 [Candidatus Levybacteria bacterium RIFCSPHIGHO2_01_FULL_37_33]OGH16383.1 MAG: hypothetical protein A3C97_02365 [Candidatus Levybacteria bacterium RIFCSPHIGHO2_02_FULL_37_11]OGH29644.1 MAG: hypothetical protein A3F30_03100 [Candidatus Levybacteria bacterium RIFCSPHIGHO2_12_FULL_37_12]OGH32466.1 MAG: hypothetical protein A2953_01755 [Candidatus Levybacteria bacterium RIFCSPLOWO2_01_FULL_36_54]OGH45810.1 MAG: hypothetical protein A3H50_02145 [Candidatus Lev